MLDARNQKPNLLRVAEYQRMQYEGEPITSEIHGCGMYDLIIEHDTLYRAPMGIFPEALLKGPLPPEYWSLGIYNLPDKSPTRLQIFANFVEDLAKLSKCTQRGVAALIANNNLSQVFSIGINGGPSGSKHQCLCNTEGKYTCIHAEANAIAKCTATDKDKIMICTLSPCVTCASLIVNTGFSAVYYIEEWKDNTGLSILSEAGITIDRIRRE